MHRGGWEKWSVGLHAVMEITRLTYRRPNRKAKPSPSFALCLQKYSIQKQPTHNFNGAKQYWPSLQNPSHTL